MFLFSLYIKRMKASDYIKRSRGNESPPMGARAPLSDSSP